MNKCTVPVTTISTYTLKNGTSCIITKYYKDHIHTVKGLTTRRVLENTHVSGDCREELLQEVRDWINNNYKHGIPTVIKTYMEEQWKL